MRIAYCLDKGAVGREGAQELLKIDPGDGGAEVLLINSTVQLTFARLPN